ncbi:hypothetical protein KCP74_20105 [Salmonella enterica subsp. enterica]|nr:hypothetical protein KCP74_20105 [Salmonella enterica subsp. enterica]
MVTAAVFPPPKELGDADRSCWAMLHVDGSADSLVTCHLAHAGLPAIKLRQQYCR